MGIFGQDWASYQPEQPDTSGLDFAFIKVTEGLTYTNPKWTAQRDHARAAGLVVGYYHYPHMGNDPAAEVRYFTSQAAWGPGDLACLDWEGYDTANIQLSPTDQAAYKDTFLHLLKDALPHNAVGLYCNRDYWLDIDTTSYCQDFLWIATAGRPAGQPGITAQWMFHQYADDSVDADYCPLPSREALQSWALSFQPTTPPAVYLGETVLSYFNVPANAVFDLPVEPAGSLATPAGGARNGPLWLCLAPQGGDGQLVVNLHVEGGVWGTPSAPITLAAAGSKYVQALPTDKGVDKVRLQCTVPLVGYLTGRQVA